VCEREEAPSENGACSISTSRGRQGREWVARMDTPLEDDLSVLQCHLDPILSFGVSIGDSHTVTSQPLRVWRSLLLIAT
jgi:hypothetical protein